MEDLCRNFCVARKCLDAVGSTVVTVVLQKKFNQSLLLVRKKKQIFVKKLKNNWKIKVLTQKQILELFEYRDGSLYWKRRIPTRKEDKFFNTLYAGKKAGSFHKSTGYRRLNYDHVDYLEHVLIFVMFKGYQPVCVDHKDGNKLNNCISNLRPSDEASNAWNSKLSKNNSSGYKGVSFHKSAKKWQGRLRCRGVNYSTGLYATPEEAFKSLSLLREKLHGEFMNNGEMAELG